MEFIELDEDNLETRDLMEILDWVNDIDDIQNAHYYKLVEFNNSVLTGAASGVYGEDRETVHLARRKAALAEIVRRDEV